MQVTETSTEGLKREFRVVVPASDLSDRVNDRLTQMKDQVKINGFRPGKVPVAHLKRVYGRAVMAETIEQMVRETNAKIVSDRGLKLAMDPKITMTEDKDEIESVIEGKTDLAYTVARRGGAADHARRFQVDQARKGHRAGGRPGGRRRAAEDRGRRTAPMRRRPRAARPRAATG